MTGLRVLVISDEYDDECKDMVWSLVKKDATVTSGRTRFITESNRWYSDIIVRL